MKKPTDYTDYKKNLGNLCNLWTIFFSRIFAVNCYPTFEENKSEKPRHSYAIDKKKGLQKRVLSYANVGATNLFTTVEDMANWMRNFNEKRVGGEEVIKKMLFKGVLNNGKEIDYARGLGIGVYKSLKTVSRFFQRG